MLLVTTSITPTTQAILERVSWTGCLELWIRLLLRNKMACHKLHSLDLMFFRFQACAPICYAQNIWVSNVAGTMHYALILFFREQTMQPPYGWGGGEGVVK